MIIATAWLTGATITFSLWLFATLRDGSSDFRRVWAPALLTSAAWPLVLIAAAAAWLGGLIVATRRDRSR